MAVEMVPLDLIDDNPYNPRSHYPRSKIDEIATSIETVGLLETPRARTKDGRFEMAFGSLRKRAFHKLAQKDPEKWGSMPLDVGDISNDQMFYFAIEENLKRADLSPIEVARGINAFLERCPEITEEKMAEALNMSQGNISNMRRVLRLPEEVLAKIDEGIINFTMGRELLVLADLPAGKNFMLEAIRGLKTGNKAYGEPVTVEGIQRCVHSIARNHLKPLDKGTTWGGRDIFFDSRAAGCLECDKMIRTHPTKSQTNHWCTGPDCWEWRQKEHKEKAAAEAKAKMEADILRRAAEQVATQPTSNISQEIPVELREKPDTTDRTLEKIAMELEKRTDERDRQLEEARERNNLERPAGNIPCDSCAKGKTCDRTFFYAATDGSGRLICDTWESEPVPTEAPLEIPADILALAKEKAGTRAEVLDLNGLWLDNWQRQLKQGYELLRDVLNKITDPNECLERCTQGFHYAFDSRGAEPRVQYVCANVKCLAKKKADWTRAKNAEGQSRKKAETKAIKEAIAQTTTLDRPRIKLVLLAQMDGIHTDKYYYQSGVKKPEIWLWEKLSAGTAAIDRRREHLFKQIDKLSDDELARLVVEFMFYYLTDKGDLESYQIKTTEALAWMGIKLEMQKEAGDGS